MARRDEKFRAMGLVAFHVPHRSWLEGVSITQKIGQEPKCDSCWALISPPMKANHGLPLGSALGALGIVYGDEPTAHEIIKRPGEAAKANNRSSSGLRCEKRSRREQTANAYHTSGQRWGPKDDALSLASR
jgi:hypothetical protein